MYLPEDLARTWFGNFDSVPAFIIYYCDTSGWGILVSCISVDEDRFVSVVRRMSVKDGLADQEITWASLSCGRALAGTILEYTGRVV